MIKRIAYVLTTLSFLVALLIATTLEGRHVYKITFEDTPCIEPSEGFEYHTCHNLTFLVNEDIEEVYEDFQTDLASIPRFLWAIFPPQESDFIGPAIIHDYLYQCPSYRPRKYADDVFYSALRERGVDSFTADVFYVAVRWFGKSNFKKDAYCIHVASFDVERDDKWPIELN